jgi:DNA adenine methylase
VRLDDLVAELDRLNAIGVPFLLSYDGSCGDRTYGVDLPKELQLVRVPIPAGQSSQRWQEGRK